MTVPVALNQTPGEPFKLNPLRAPFVMHEIHFAIPREYHLQLLRPLVCLRTVELEPRLPGIIANC